MITKGDVEKLKETFATKEDLKNTTDQLVELISGGFNRMESYFTRITDNGRQLDHHEVRLDKLEDKVFE